MKQTPGSRTLRVSIIIKALNEQAKIAAAVESAIACINAGNGEPDASEWMACLWRHGPHTGAVMIAIRSAKVLMVAAMALFATLVTFGNVTDYETNFAFVQHVLSMDTIFERSTIRYRAITVPALHHIAYGMIIATEATIAVLCWIGAFALLRRLRAQARSFHRAKSFAVAGLTLGFLLWQTGFMTMGGEWFGMWQSQRWNGVPSAFRFVMVMLGVLIFLCMPDEETEKTA